MYAWCRWDGLRAELQGKIRLCRYAATYDGLLLYYNQNIGNQDLSTMVVELEKVISAV